MSHSLTDPETFDAIAGRLNGARQALSDVILGQDRVIEETLITLLSGGHALIVGVPGLAKTKLVTALAQVLMLPAQRIQCTPDLMPADILGSEVLETATDGSRVFRFIEGPVFTSLLMADEINRASPRTQSALLQAMQERSVTVAGQDRPLPAPFHVLATQNPIEQEGTYPLPEAQLDRFLLEINVDYPNGRDERRMLLETTGLADQQPPAVLSAELLMAAQQLVRAMPIGDEVVDGILALVRSARPETPEAHPLAKEALSWGPGPRAGQALMLASRARALLQGRYAPSLDDVVALAEPVLRHRIALNFEARAAGRTPQSVIGELLAPLR